MRSSPVPIVTLDADAGGVIDHAANAEVFLAIAIVYELHKHTLAVTDAVVAADVEKRLVQRQRKIRRQSRKSAAGPERHRRVFMDLLEGPEIMGSIADNRAAERQTKLLMRVIILLKIERAFGTQRLIPEEPEHGPFDGIGARPGDDRKSAARRAADLGV